MLLLEDRIGLSSAAMPTATRPEYTRTAPDTALDEAKSSVAFTRPSHCPGFVAFEEEGYVVPWSVLGPCEIDMLSHVCRIVFTRTARPLTRSRPSASRHTCSSCFINGLITEEELLDAERSRPDG